MDDRILQIQKLLDSADGNLSTARTMIREMTADESAPLDLDKKLEGVNSAEEKVIEGVFDGESMVSPDGQVYPVPPNYASKSKLVEGDTLKLTISGDGSFVFKQIAPTERRNAVGTLALTDGSYTVSAEGKSYKVLTASVTFYKAEPGDQVTITLPKEHDAVWASLENVIRKAIAIENATGTEAPEEVVAPEPSVIPAAELSVPNVGESTVSASVDAPDIEFPSGTTELSDEQLLENLKNNLKNISQPAYTAPEVASGPAKPASLDARQVDNIVANDLAQLDRQSTTNNQQSSDDKPIAELDI